MAEGKHFICMFSLLLIPVKTILIVSSLPLHIASNKIHEEKFRKWSAEIAGDNIPILTKLRSRLEPVMKTDERLSRQSDFVEEFKG